MNDAPRSVADIGFAISHETRVRALEFLMSGCCLTGTELARACRAPLSSMSEHLLVLERAGLVHRRKASRHSYFELASPQVAVLLEAAGLLAAARPVRTLRESELQRHERNGRLCYDHLAGQLGVALRQALIDEALVECRGDECIVTREGARSISAWCQAQIEEGAILVGCVDGTERRLHLRGTVARAIANAFLRRGWLQRGSGRAVRVTPLGARENPVLATVEDMQKAAAGATALRAAAVR
ncbi:MAG: winged helix-turn-helix transcriptional regulator [Candidatus Eremiobacteraeota bacterium]|nr:winged helix-turn-helix transcriptional regulator [Candidatus Eremiobacteraeota bacterium]